MLFQIFQKVKDQLLSPVFFSPQKTEPEAKLQVKWNLGGFFWVSERRQKSPSLRLKKIQSRALMRWPCQRASDVESFHLRAIHLVTKMRCQCMSSSFPALKFTVPHVPVRQSQTYMFPWNDSFSIWRNGQKKQREFEKNYKLRHIKLKEMWIQKSLPIFLMILIIDKHLV